MKSFNDMETAVLIKTPIDIIEAGHYSVVPTAVYIRE